MKNVIVNVIALRVATELKDIIEINLIRAS